MSTTRRATLRVGTSGYQYDHWRGVFYPAGLAKKNWLAHYARHFDTVEINNTFYHLPAATTFTAWAQAAPADFCYALKFSRYGTHMKKLKDPEATVAAFWERAQLLGRYLGPILVQLPPRWHCDPPRLAAFLAALPSGRQRWALEVRDASWLCETVYALLRKHHVALCIHDLIADHPRELTADWTYLRYHGDHYGGSYSPQKLSAEARWLRQQLQAGRDAYVYFNNDAEGWAVRNAADLRRYVG